MPRWTNTNPDSTQYSNQFKVPKTDENENPIVFSSCSSVLERSKVSTTVSSTVNVNEYQKNGFGFDESEEEDAPEVNKDGIGKVYGPTNKKYNENCSAVSSTDDWNSISPIESAPTVSDFLKETPVVADSKVVIPLRAPDYMAQTNGGIGGNSSYLSKTETLRLGEGASSTSTSTFSWGSSNRTAGDVGLTNLGNTCFLNSGLQCLLHSGKLVEFFLTCKSFESNSVALPLIQAFQIVIQQAWSGKFDTLPLNDFRSTLGGIHSQFKDGRQHDCQEFLALTLDTLHEQLKKWKVDKIEPEPEVNGNLSCEEEMLNSMDLGCTEGPDSSTMNMEVENGVADDGVNSDEVSSSTSPPIPASSSSGYQNGIKERPRRKQETTHHFMRKKACVGLHSKNIQSTSKPKFQQEPDEQEKKELIDNKLPKGCRAKNARKKSTSDTNARSDNETVRKKVKVGSETAGTSSLATLACKGEEQRTSSLQQLKNKADEYWNTYMKENNTVISSNFQGVHKSKVVCSKCAYISTTYEPFMFLNLPIPRITTKDLKVRLVRLADISDTATVNITVNLNDNIAKLKDEVMKKFSDISVKDRIHDFAVAEVANHFVVRILEDSHLVKFISDTNRNIYMYELNNNFNSDEYVPTIDNPFEFGFYTESTNTLLQPKTYIDEDWDNDDNPLPATQEINPTEVLSGDDPLSQGTDLGIDAAFVNPDHLTKSETPCCICLENLLYSELRKHQTPTNSCGCVVCSECLKRGADHYSTSMVKNNCEASGSDFIKCPVCLEVVNHEEEFVPFSTADGSNCDNLHQMHMIRILFRCESDSNNNSALQRVFGTPYVVKVPVTLTSMKLREYFSTLNPFAELDCKIQYTVADGTRCDFCVYSTNGCSGCELRNDDTHVEWGTDRTFAFCYSNISEAQMKSLNPLDMMKVSNAYISTWSSSSNEPQVDIYDCLESFSEIENLDEQNGWFCPNCKKNQCATKSMNICKFPDYLIVYLKRFVYADNIGLKLNNKLSFPLTNLDLTRYISEECVGSLECVYDLYACVCHFGSASAGHYTAFGKNPVTQLWNNFNDSMVSQQTPGENDYASAYVLFYERKGITCNIPRPETIRILPSYSRTAYVAPYSKGCLNSQNLKLNKTEGIDNAACMQPTVSSSDSTSPHASSQDVVNSLKFNDGKSSIPNGFATDDEDQENLLPPKSLSHMNGSAGDQSQSFGLSRKDRHLHPVNANGDKIITES